MATIKKTVLGRISGAVGDVVFKEKNGKNFVGLRASSFMPGIDTGSMERRAKFSLCTQLASTINSNSQLKSLWLEAIPAGVNVYNHLIKTNYKNLLYNNVTDFVTIVPVFGFNASLGSIIYNPSSIEVTTDAFRDTAGLNTSVETKIQLASVLYLSGPVDESVKQHNFISLNSMPQTLVLDTDMTFSLMLSNQLVQLLGKYTNRKAFLSLLTLDANDEIVNFSSTFIG